MNRILLNLNTLPQFFDMYVSYPKWNWNGTLQLHSI